MFKLIKIIIGTIIFLIVSVIIFAVVIIVLNRGNKPKQKQSSFKVENPATFCLNVNVKDSYVVVKKSKTEYVNISYYESKTRPYDVVESSDGNTLSVTGNQIGKWYNRILLTFKFTKVYETTIEIPDDISVIVTTDNGNIRYEDAYASNFSAITTNGGIIMKNANAGSANLDTVNGHIEITGTTVGYLNAKTRKGNVSLENFTSIGIAYAQTDKGDIKLTNITTVGDCKIHTGKGNITGTIRVTEDDYYNIIAKAVNGTCNLTNKETETAIAYLDVETLNGNIDIAIKKVAL